MKIGQRERLRMVQSPEEALDSQVGWIYEAFSFPGEKVKLRLVELPDGTEPRAIVELEMHRFGLERYFESTAEDDITDPPLGKMTHYVARLAGNCYLCAKKLGIV